MSELNTTKAETNEEIITSNPETDPKEIHCKHYVKRKKRYCKMTVKTGFTYCGEHLPPDPNAKKRELGKDDKTLRIVCPLDNKHTCFAHKLQKHLKICNARPDPKPYIQKGVNCGDIQPNSQQSIVNSRQLSSVPIEHIKVLIDKINKIYSEYIEGNISTLFKTFDIVEKELLKPEYGDKTKKHLIQASAIVGILQAKGMLAEKTCFIEFGAGKGQLSYWMTQAIKDLQGSSVLLVERASHRHKFDNKVDKVENSIHRVKVDIGDLLLHEVEVIKSSKGIIGVTKHLCGDATDLSMRCMANYEQNGGHVGGLVMAFCCHHRCQWSAYVGKEFFNKCALTRDDFDVICGMVSWAVCGNGLARDNSNATTEHQNDRDKELGITRDAKEEIGRKCKNILNYGRLDYLRRLGYNCSLNYYVEPTISLENVCIVATKNSELLNI